jgi:hypothetical protein
VKNHFYAIWVVLRVLRETKEIRQLHGILSKLQIPTYLGRLPALMGTSAGGSLTADQWLIAAIAALPVMLPQIYAQCTQTTVDGDAVLFHRKQMFSKIREDKKAKKAKAKKAPKKKKQSSGVTNLSCYSELFEPPPDSPSGCRRSPRSRKPAAWTLVSRNLLA